MWQKMKNYQSNNIRFWPWYLKNNNWQEKWMQETERKRANNYYYLCIIWWADSGRQVNTWWDINLRVGRRHQCRCNKRRNPKLRVRCRWCGDGSRGDIYQSPWWELRIRWFAKNWTFWLFKSTRVYRKGMLGWLGSLVCGAQFLRGIGSIKVFQKLDEEESIREKSPKNWGNWNDETPKFRRKSKGFVVRTKMKRKKIANPASCKCNGSVSNLSKSSGVSFTSFELDNQRKGVGVVA